MTARTLHLGEEFRRVVEAEARRAYPRECCGLIIGSDIDNGWEVNDIAPSDNVAPADRPDRFEVDPALFLKLQRELRGSGRRIVGIYHSHPDAPAVPSQTDRAMAWQPDMVWLIQSVEERKPRGLAAFWRSGFDDEVCFQPVRIAGMD